MLYLVQKLFVTTQIFVKQHNHKTQKYGITEIDTAVFCLLFITLKRWKANWVVMGYNGYMLWKLLPGCGGKVSRGSGTGSCYDEKLCCCCCGVSGGGGWRRCALLPSHLRRVMSRDGEILFLVFTLLLRSAAVALRALADTTCNGTTPLPLYWGSWQASCCWSAPPTLTKIKRVW